MQKMRRGTNSNPLSRFKILSDLSLYDFEKLKSDSKYRHFIVISGNPSEADIVEALNNIYYEYIDIFGLDKDYRRLIVKKQKNAILLFDILHKKQTHFHLAFTKGLNNRLTSL